MTGLYITLIVLAVIGLVIFIPVTAVISFAVNSDKNEIIIRYLFFKRIIYPAEPKEEKEDEKEPEAEEEKPKQKRKVSVKDYISLVRASWNEIRWGISKLLYYIIKHAVIIKELNISAEFGLEDAMKTGLAAGAVNAFAHNVIGLLDNKARLKRWNADLKPNFDEPCMRAGVYCRLSTRIAHIFPLGMILLRAYIKIKRRINKENKIGGKSNE